MIITGMAEYESVCKNALVKWYNSHNETKITLENVFVVWACKTLQNYKALLSTTVSGDGIYAEYTLKGRGYLVLLFSDSIGYSRLYFCC